MRRRWRWGVAILLLAVVAGLPSLIASRPVHRVGIDPETLLARIRGSAGVAWSGYGESRGTVALPDVKQLGDLTSMLGTRTRYRVWWHDASQHRVDALSLTGETDTTGDDTGSWRWSSDAGAAVRIVGSEPVRLPDETDLVAPTLARRLAGTPDVTLSSLAARRVAGRTAAGIRLTPRSPSRTTIAYVDLYADSSSGLALEVDIRAVGDRRPLLTSVLLQLSRNRPTLAQASFAPGSNRTSISGGDLAAQVDQRSPYLLPDLVGGLPQSRLLNTAQGLATYGQGFGQVVLLPLARGQGRDLARSVSDLGGRFETPLLNGLLVQDGYRRRYLLVGTVPDSALDVMSADLLAHPPPQRQDQ